MVEHSNPARGANEWADTYGDLGAEAPMRLAMLPLNILDPWVNPSGRPQPFKPYSMEKLLDLAESIRENGVIEPICVRPMPDGRFQIIAGHNRVEASKLARLTTIPVVIRPLSDAKATILMVDSNFQHREKLLPSEIAFGYLELMEAMKIEKKRHVGRPPKNYSPSGNNFQGTTTGGELAALKGVSKNQIFRYIRLTYLIKPLLELVDNGKFALQAAVEISYLNEDAQAKLLLVMEGEPCKAPSLAKAKKLRAIYDAGELDEDAILAVMVAPKDEPVSVKLPMARIARFFPAHAPEELILSTIEAALEAWKPAGKKNTPASV